MEKLKIKRILKIALYLLLPVAVAVLGVSGGDKWYFIATSVVAVTYLLLMSDGKRFAFLLCAVFGLAHGAASFYAGLYASAVYHAALLAPIGIYRFVTANKPQNTKVGALSLWKWFVCVAAIGVAITALYFVLKATGGAQPVLDAATLAISVITAFLMLKNYREFWLFNLFSALLYVALWTVQFIKSGEGLAVAGLQSIVTVISAIGFVNWLRMSKREKASAEELSEKKS